ncbi:YjjG family noncanonical pyrimidine nucleotidase [Clostridium sp.]|uniref:YjjG family noncanonical pyrimidine nucleotidase n=1 Tax=Clostridium sp. TaxID=1506 RepID=UPI003F3EA2E3
MKYEVILFDADDTLFDFKKTEDYAFNKLLENFNIGGDKANCREIYNKINSKLWKDFEQGLITSDALKVERFVRFLEELNENHDASEFSNKYVEFLGEGSFIFDEAVELLEYLKEKYRLAIITNGLAKVQNNRIRKSEIANYFEDFIISDEVKIAKPDARIFEYALKSLNHIDKSKVLMVGDSLSSDIKGGQNFGIDTCWFNINGIKNESEIKPTYEIKNILELKELI